MDDDDRPWFRRPGWIVSALLHGGVVGLTFVSFAPTYEPPPVEEFVPVSMLPIADATSVKASAKAEDPKPEPKPAAKPDPKLARKLNRMAKRAEEIADGLEQP